jgi:hypothetical protein
MISPPPMVSHSQSLGLMVGRAAPLSLALSTTVVAFHLTQVFVSSSVDTQGTSLGSSF